MNGSNKMQNCDIVICYKEDTGSELAKVLLDYLEKKGCYSVLYDDTSILEKTPAVYILVYTAGFFECADNAKDHLTETLLHAIQSESIIIPVWFNNCKDWKFPSELPSQFQRIAGLEISTLDFLGTDFALSINKVFDRFPAALTECAKKIIESRQSSNWLELLSEYPHVIDYPDLKDRSVLQNLSDMEWAYLLVQQPKILSEKHSCWELIKNNSYIWRVLLCYHPEVSDFCNWRVLTGFDWLPILIEQPQLAKKCPWRKLTELQWIQLLAFRPEFSEHFDFSHKLGCAIDSDRYAEEYPQFPCPLSTLLLKRPEFIDRCNLDLLPGKSIVELLLSNVGDRNVFDLHKLDGACWSKLLSVRPEFADVCEWDKFDEMSAIIPFADWLSLLDKQPQFADRCPWGDFTTQAWINLLIKHPEFESRRCWKTKLDENDRLGLDFDKKVKDLIIAQPKLVGKCELSSLTCKDWIEIITAHPDLMACCDINSMPVNDAMKLLAHVPQLADKCEWSRLADAKDWQWLELVKAQPLFRAKYSGVLQGEVLEKENDESDGFVDVYICLRSGNSIAERLAEALERRGYSVHVNNSGKFDEEEIAWLAAAKFFVLLRIGDIFEAVQDPDDYIRIQIETAIKKSKQIIVTAPTDDQWQYNGILPDSIESIASEQVKNLDMGDLFEEKVDALVRESMISVKGSLFKDYDIFISYRRSTGARFARRVQQRLKELGYISFLDYDSILNGRYDKVIRKAVDSAPVFLMLLTDNSLDRCADKQDWVAEEIRMAHNKGKCIVPITPSDQHWEVPENLPQDMLWVKDVEKYVIMMDGGNFNESLLQIEELFPNDLKVKMADIKEMLSGTENIFGQKTGCDWAALLKKYPDLVGICPIEELSLSDKRDVLVEHPYLTDKLRCQLEDFYQDALDELEEFEKTRCEGFWSELLERHPEYADACDVSRLDSSGWASLIVQRPEYAQNCDWNSIDVSDQVRILRSHPEFISECNLDNFDSSCWCSLLECQPQFADVCNWQDIVDSYYPFGYPYVAEMIIAQPQLASRIDWRKAQKDDGAAGLFWAHVLINQPKISFSNWDIFYGQIDEGSTWEDVGVAWADLLAAHPEFGKYCEWERLTEEEKDSIAMNAPDIAKRNGYVLKSGSEVPGDDNVEQLKWTKRELLELSRCEWQTLLEKHPELNETYQRLKGKIRVNKIHYDHSAQVDDFNLEWQFATNFNQKIEKVFGVKLKYSIWAPSRRLRFKGIAFKDGGALSRVVNDLDIAVQSTHTLDTKSVEVIPGLLTPETVDGDSGDEL